jgi:hypothetical protein
VNEGQVTCSSASLAAGGTATFTIDVTPMTPGAIHNSASVAADESDPNTGNNVASADTTAQDPATTPDQSAGFANGTQPTTIQTSNDGVQFSQITVPAGVSGPVTVDEQTQACDLPQPFVCVGPQVLRLTAPNATKRNPLVVKLLVAKRFVPPGFRTKNGVAFHDGAKIPACKGKGVSPEPSCLSSVRFVKFGGIAFVQYLILTEINGSWRPAR